MITGSGFGVHDRDWIDRNIPPGRDMCIREITDNYSVLNLCGPCSRRILEKVTESDVSNATFPYLTFQDIEIDGLPVKAVRLSYTGELGWELYMENEYALKVYRKLFEVGQEYRITNAGYRALDSLRMENGYLYWSGEISPYVNPHETGLSYRINSRKEQFVGRKALQKIANNGVKRKLYCFSYNGFVPLYGGEPLLCEDEVISSTLSGGYGHSVGKSICYAFLPADQVTNQHFQLETVQGTISIESHEKALYSESNIRVRE